MPKISIIIPVYNVEGYLARCVESVIGQTFKDLEIFLVDDGSTDNSGKMCDEYALKDSRIKVFHKENGGISSARNVALTHCTGECIGFVDSDDYIDTDYFEKLLCAITESGADIAVAGLASDNGSWIRKNKTESKVIEGNHAIVENYLKVTDINHMVYNKIYKAELFSDVQFNEDLRKNEDVWFTISILKKVSKAVFVPDCYYYIFVRENSLERSKFCDKDLFLLDVTEYRRQIVTAEYKDLYYLIAYEMAEHITALQKRILNQHGKRKNRAFYNDLTLRLRNELEKLPQEYKTGKKYKKYLSVLRHQRLFTVQQELKGCFYDAKKLIKRVLLWIK